MGTILKRRLTYYNIESADHDTIHLETDADCVLRRSGTSTVEDTLMSLGTLATQNTVNIVTESEGTLPVDRGGTNATNAATARTNLGITPANIGAATTNHTHSEYALVNHTHSEYSLKGHTHEANSLTTENGPLILVRGGTGLTASPWLQVDLASGGSKQILGKVVENYTTSENPIKLGVTGTLPVANGGTGASTPVAARTNLGITPANIGAAPSVHTHGISQISNIADANTRSSLVLRTQDASGSPHGADNYLMYARYDAYGDRRFGIKVDGFESRVDFATNCVTPNGDTVSNWLTALNNSVGSALKVKSGSYVGQGDASTISSFGPQISYGLNTTYAFFIHFSYTTPSDGGRCFMTMPYVMADAIDTSADPKSYYISIPVPSGSFGLFIAIAKNYFYPVYYMHSNHMDTYTSGITYNWFAIGT